MKKLKKWIPLFGLSLALAIIVIDGTVMSVSIKYIMSDLGITLQQIQTIMTSYTLVVAALTITGGRLGDLFGYRKMFRIGAITFAIGSIIASFSPTGSVLMLGWALLEGIGAALMTPATTALIISTYKGRDRNLAFAVWGATAGASAAFGPILGGYLTTNYSWRWAFRINVFIVMLLLATTLTIKEHYTKSLKHHIDWLGVFLSSTGIGLITYGIIKSSDHGWIFPKKAFEFNGHEILPFGYSAVIFMIAFGLALVLVFLWWEKRLMKQGKTPLIDLTVFKNRAFATGILTSTVLTLGQAGIIFSIPIFFQSVLKLDAFETGIGILPMSLTIIVSAPLSMKIARKIRPKYLIQIGLLISMSGLYILHETLSVSAQRSDFIPGLVVFAVGLGFVMAQITNLTLSEVDTDKAGEASGLNSTARQVGQTFGTAVIGAIFLATMSATLISSIRSSEILPAKMKDQIVTVVEDDPSSLQFGADEKFKSDLTNQPSDIKQLLQVKTQQAALMNRIMSAISDSAGQASVDGAKKALEYTGVFYLLTFAVTMFLPNKKLSGKAMPMGGH